MNQGPSRFLRLILRILCPKERMNEVEGDLNELYQIDLNKKGRTPANINYLLSSFSMINFQGYFQFLRFSNFLSMLRLILSHNLRSILRFKINVIMGILTLALGASTCGFLLYYFHYENNYDRFHPEAQNIYRLNTLSQNDRGEQSILAIAPVPSGPMIEKDFEEVLAFTRVQKLAPVVSIKDKKFEEDRFFLVDNSFFELFPYPIIKGNNQSPLIDPQSVVLTQSMAKKYFGDEDPIGETIHINTKKTFALNFTEMAFTITAIVEDPPINTHLKYDFLASFSTLGDFKSKDWLGGVATYLKFATDPNKAILNEKLRLLVRENLGPYLEARFKMTF